MLVLKSQHSDPNTSAIQLHDKELLPLLSSVLEDLLDLLGFVPPPCNIHLDTAHCCLNEDTLPVEFELVYWEQACFARSQVEELQACS